MAKSTVPNQVDETSIVSTDDNTAIELVTFEDRIMDCYERNALFSAGLTPSGNPVKISDNVLLDFYTQNLLDSLAEFSHTFEVTPAEKVTFKAPKLGGDVTDTSITINLDTDTVLTLTKVDDTWQGESTVKVSAATVKSLAKKVAEGKKLGKVNAIVTDAVKQKYRVFIFRLADSDMKLKLIPVDADDMPVLYASMTHNRERNIWAVDCYSDSAFTEKFAELPYERSQWQLLNRKALKHGSKLPLVRMYNHAFDLQGNLDESQMLVSPANMYSIIMMYVRGKMSEMLVTTSLDESTGKSTTARIKFPESTIAFIAQVFYSQMQTDSNAELMPMADYFGKFMQVNWPLIASHADMAASLEATSDQPKLSGDEIFQPDPNSTF